MLPLPHEARFLLDKADHPDRPEALQLLAELAAQLARAGVRPSLEEWRLAHPLEREALAAAVDAVELQRAVAAGVAAHGRASAAAVLAPVDGGALMARVSLDELHAEVLAAATGKVRP